MREGKKGLATETLVSLGLFVFAIALTIVLVFNIFGWFGVNYQYQQAIGANISNAYDASTFEVMRDQLVLAIKGMHDQGLQPGDCGRAWSWERTRDWCMAYQYVYLDGLVNRTEYYIRVFAANNTPPFTDVYTRAIENMRAEFNRNGPADWVAQPAWLLKYHPEYYWNYGLYEAIGALCLSAFPLASV